MQGASRCPTHRRPSHLRSRHERGYDNEWARISKAAIAAQPWCTWCGATEDLTADHLVPLSKGGAKSIDNARVLCRSCNSRRGNR